MKTFVVYKITNLKNGRVYIGSTNNFEVRRAEHFGQLRTKKHSNFKLQLDFEINGEDIFVIDVVKTDFLTRQAMLIAEYELILKLTKDDYNIDKNCPVEGIHNPKNKRPSRKQLWAAHLKWKSKNKSKSPSGIIKTEHPALDKIAQKKREREMIRGKTE